MKHSAVGTGRRFDPRSLQFYPPRYACLTRSLPLSSAAVLCYRVTGSGLSVLTIFLIPLNNQKCPGWGEPVQTMMRNQRCDLPAGRQAGLGNPAEVSFA